MYSDLWIALIGQDMKKVESLAYQMGIGEYFKYLPLILMWKTKGAKKLGMEFTEEDKKKFHKGGLKIIEKMNNVVQKLPEHMLYIIKASDMVSIHNSVLGGSLRERLLMFTWIAYKNNYGNGFLSFWKYYLFRVKLFVLELYIEL